VRARARVCVQAKGRSSEDGGIPLHPPSASLLPVGPLQPQANLVSANDGLCREMRASQGRDVSLATLAGCRESKMAALDPRDVPTEGVGREVVTSYSIPLFLLIQLMKRRSLVRISSFENLFDSPNAQRSIPLQSARKRANENHVFVIF